MWCSQPPKIHLKNSYVVLLLYLTELLSYLHKMSHNNILNNRDMISGKRHYCWVFQMYFFGTVSTTFRAAFSPIILERRQKYLRPISPKLDNSHQNSLDSKIVLQVRGKICSFTFGVNCPFKKGRERVEKDGPVWDED